MNNVWKMTWLIYDAKKYRSSFSIYVEDTGQTGTLVEVADTVTATLKTIFSGAVVSCSVSMRIVPPVTQFERASDAEVNSDVEEGGVIVFDGLADRNIYTMRLPTLKEEYYDESGLVITSGGSPIGLLCQWLTVLDFPSDVYDSGAGVSYRGTKLARWTSGTEKFIPRR